MRILFALTLLALLAGAALACGGSVPPPGATLSGFVYHDANANGIRDSCDRGSVRQITEVALLPLDDNGVALGGSSPDGAWTIKDVPPGDYVLALNQPYADSSLDSYWLTTAPKVAGGEPRYELTVRGFEVIDSLDFGVAYVNPITTVEGRYALVTVLFDDLDSDGEADPGECPLEAPFGFELPVSVSLQSDLTEAPTKVSVPNIPPIQPGWGFTDPCEDTAPRQSSVDGIYLATLGMRRAEGAGVMKISSFLDVDMDGLRSETEQPLNMLGTFITPAGADGCLLAPNAPRARGPREQLTFEGLPAGEWDVTVKDWSTPPSPNRPGQIATATGGRTHRVSLQDGETLDLQLAFRPAGASYIEIHAIEDLNRNGRADPGEPGAAEVPIGYIQVDDYYSWCDVLSFVDGGGTTIGPVINASYSVSVAAYLSKTCPGGRPEEVYWRSDQPAQVVSVGEGEKVSLTLLVYHE